MNSAKSDVKIPDIKITAAPVTENDIRKRCCCNCRHDIRIKNESGMVTHCECEIDHHYISYNQTFEGWCNHWSKDPNNN